MSYQENITRIKAVYNALGELGDQVAFIGGAAVSLYATRLSAETRPTDDIDVVIEVVSLVDFSRIEEKLRQKGFAHAVDSNVICRYTIDGVVVDIMPTRGEILGFSNPWYEEAFKHAVGHQIDNLHTIQIFTAPYFLACKLEAFKSRGRDDGRLSSDFEDIVYILNNRIGVFDEILSMSGPVRKYIADEFLRLRQKQHLPEWISCHLEYSEIPRTQMIVDGIETVIVKTTI